MTTRDITIRARLDDQVSPIVRKQTAAFKQLNAVNKLLTKELLDESEAFQQLRNAVDDTTDRLKIFGRRGEILANSLEDISDPVERLTRGQQLLDAETARLETRWGKAGTKIQGFGANLSRFSPRAGEAVNALGNMTGALGNLSTGTVVAGAAVAGTALAVGALSVAAGYVAIKGWQQYAEGSWAAQDAIEKLNVSQRGFLDHAGAVVEDAAQVSDVMYGLGAAMDEATGKTGSFGEQWSEMQQDTQAALKSTGLGVLVPQAYAFNELRFALAEYGQERRKLDEQLANTRPYEIATSAVDGYEAEIQRAIRADADFERALDSLSMGLNDLPVEQATKAINAIGISFKVAADYAQDFRRQSQDAMANVSRAERDAVRDNWSRPIGYRAGRGKKSADKDRLKLQRDLNRATERYNRLVREGRQDLAAMERDAAGKAAKDRMAADKKRFDVGAGSEFESGLTDREQQQLQRLLEMEQNVATQRQQLYADTAAAFTELTSTVITGTMAQLGANAAMGKGWQDVGKTITGTFSPLLGMVGEGVTQLAMAMLAAGTGNPIAMLAAGGALAFLSGAFKSFGQGGGSGNRPQDITAKLSAIGDEFMGNAATAERNTYLLKFERDGLRDVVGTMAQEDSSGAMPRGGLRPSFMPMGA